MAIYRSIQCQDCGRSYETRRRNTKVCGLCRIARNLKFYGEQTKTCWECEERFAPTEGHQVLCGKCDDVKRVRYGFGQCALCNQDLVPLLSPELAVCIPCSRTAEKRPLFYRAVLKKQRSIIAAADPATAA